MARAQMHIQLFPQQSCHLITRHPSHPQNNKPQRSGLRVSGGSLCLPSLHHIHYPNLGTSYRNTNKNTVKRHAARLTPESLSAFCLVASRKRFSLSQCNLEPLELSLELPGKSVVSVETLFLSGGFTLFHPYQVATPKTSEKNPRYPRVDTEEVLRFARMSVCFLCPFFWVRQNYTSTMEIPF